MLLVLRFFLRLLAEATVLVDLVQLLLMDVAIARFRRFGLLLMIACHLRILAIRTISTSIDQTRHNPVTSLAVLLHQPRQWQQPRPPPGREMIGLHLPPSECESGKMIAPPRNLLLTRIAQDWKITITTGPPPRTGCLLRMSLRDATRLRLGVQRSNAVLMIITIRQTLRTIHPISCQSTTRSYHPCPYPKSPRRSLR
jgi:hypothetical protein